MFIVNNSNIEATINKQSRIRLFIVVVTVLIVSILSFSSSYGSQMLSPNINGANVSADQPSGTHETHSNYEHSHSLSDSGCFQSSCHFFTFNDAASIALLYRNYITFYGQNSEPKLAFNELEISPPKIT